MSEHITTEEKIDFIYSQLKQQKREKIFGIIWKFLYY